MGSPQTTSILETPRLRLRELTDRDVGPLYEVLSDPHSMRYYPHPSSLEDTRAWIARWRISYVECGFGLWAIEDKTTGAVIGDCGPNMQEVDGVPEVEIGWHVHPARQRQGFATEAAIAVRDHCFAALDRESVVALVRPQNKASGRVAEKIGMTVDTKTVHANLPHLVYRVRRGEPTPR